jgi:microsomal dipeptidase-like Zn-dependent dipeptidase
MLVVDLHSDIQLDLDRPGVDPAQVLASRHAPEMLAGGIAVRNLSTVSPAPNSTGRALRHLAAAFAAGCPIATTPNALDSPSPVYILGLEGSEPFADDIELVRAFHRLGIRIFQLAWMHANAVTGTCGDVVPTGLSEFGTKVVSLIGELGGIIDLAHISDRGFRDVVDIADAPIMCSHTCARQLNDHPRNITDEQIKWIADRDGIVGLAFVNDFLGGSPATIGTCVDHLEHFVEIAGQDHVGLGPDWCGYALDILEPLNANAERPVNVRCGEPIGLETPAGLPLLAAALEERGLPTEKVMGGNALRFLRKALASGASKASI